MIELDFPFYSNNQRLQRAIFHRWQVFKSFSGQGEPIMAYAQNQKTYGMSNTYRQFDLILYLKLLSFLLYLYRTF